MKLLSKLTRNLRPNYSPSNLQLKRGGFRDNLIILLQQSIQERISRRSITTSPPPSALNPFYSLPSHLPEQKIRLGETPRLGETEAAYPPSNRRSPAHRKSKFRPLGPRPLRADLFPGRRSGRSGGGWFRLDRWPMLG